MKSNPSSPATAPSGQTEEAVFAVNAGLDRKAMRRRFDAHGRVQIADFLAKDGAERLLRHLQTREDWLLVMNQDDKLFELDRTAQAALTAEQREQLDLAVYRSARTGFQYRYATIRVPDSARERAADATLLTRLADFLSSAEAMDFLRDVTGAAAIRFADAQATAYGPGHFLTSHDDKVAGKNRHAAYVLGLSTGWRPDWGGVLLFEGEEGRIEEGFAPRFNALNLFRVPARHSVSLVSPAAPYRRYSVTGWLRSIDPPA